MNIFSGCTEKLPLSPVYSNDADWTPAISLYQNGYQRVEVLIDRPTRKELWRNISFLTLQARTSTNASYDDIDTLNGTSAAPTEAYGGVYPIFFQSKPRFDFGTDYSVRVASHFGTGEIRFSNELAVRTPPSIGKVLKRLTPQEPSYYPADLYLSFHRGSLFMLRQYQISRVDTGNGQVTPVKVDFRPPYDKSQYRLLGWTVIADTAYSFYPESDDYTKKRLVSLNLNTLHIDSNITISTPGKGLVTIVSHRAELYGFWWTTSGSKQAGIINPRTGEVIRWLPETSGYLSASDGTSSDGTNIFYCRSVDYDSRITSIDPVTMNTVKENRNPIFRSTGLTWDGANFWVIDYETQTFAKIKLEGM
jgi:hypothetical protein